MEEMRCLRSKVLARLCRVRVRLRQGAGSGQLDFMRDVLWSQLGRMRKEWMEGCSVEVR